MKTPLFLTGLLLSASLFAQGDIQLTHFIADYTEITGGETYSDENWDDPEIDIPLDFSFSFGNSEITNIIQLGYGAEWTSISAAGIDFIAYGGDVISSALADEQVRPLRSHGSPRAMPATASSKSNTRMPPFGGK